MNNNWQVLILSQKFIKVGNECVTGESISSSYIKVFKDNNHRKIIGAGFRKLHG